MQSVVDTPSRDAISDPDVRPLPIPAEVTMGPQNPDPARYERPIEARYVDPLELVWLATARRLGLVIRRDPTIFSKTLGDGVLWLGPRDDLDPDDTLAQMLLHELCHWFTNGIETFHVPDWGFDLGDDDDPLEFACLRLQAWLADRHGLRGMFGPTGKFRAYFDRIPADPLAPLDDGPWEARILELARRAIGTASADPYLGILDDALAATAAIRNVVASFAGSYATEVDEDPLPSLWYRDAPCVRRTTGG